MPQPLTSGWGRRPCAPKLTGVGAAPREGSALGGLGLWEPMEEMWPLRVVGCLALENRCCLLLPPLLPEGPGWQRRGGRAPTLLPQGPCLRPSTGPGHAAFPAARRPVHCHSVPSRSLAQSSWRVHPGTRNSQRPERGLMWWAAQCPVELMGIVAVKPGILCPVPLPNLRWVSGLGSPSALEACTLFLSPHQHWAKCLGACRTHHGGEYPPVRGLAGAAGIQLTVQTIRAASAYPPEPAPERSLTLSSRPAWQPSLA